jgi:hypothetical protein
VARHYAADGGVAGLSVTIWQEERMASAGDRAPRGVPSFPMLFLGKVVLLFVTILVVWIIYAYLHAYRLDWLGWFYSKLLPLTNGLYALVENYFPSDVKYKVRGAITDDLGQRSIFLLLLTATVELSLYSLFKFIKALVGSLRERRSDA